MSNLAAVKDDQNRIDTIALSMSEISSLITSAARGVGFEWGEADEAAYAACWLSCAGFDWADFLLAVFTKTGLRGPSCAGHNWSSDAQLCPIRTGVALADFAMLDNGPAEHSVNLIAVFQPVLVLPFVARVAGALNKTINVSWADTKIYICASGKATIVNHGAWPESANMTIASQENSDAPFNASTIQLSAISILKYQSLSKLALQMTVPTSTKSQAGAGAAGGDDN